MATMTASGRRGSRQKGSRKGNDSFNDDLDELSRYRSVFAELSKFVDTIRDTEAELLEARQRLMEAKAEYDEAKATVESLADIREGARHGLVRYLSRGEEILPLFDQMEPASDEIHGEHSTEWRSEPISALKLSLPSQIALNDAEIMLVGQLQDRVLAKPETWWEEVSGLSFGTAVAIVDRLNDFINKRSSQ